MKCAMRCSVISLGALGIAAIAALPAHAQFVSIPISNGSFALQGTATGGTVYSTPLTLLSPVGTINISNPPLPSSNTASPAVMTGTPVGMALQNVTGSATLNDGRTATFNGNGFVSMKAIPTITGSASSNFLPTAPNVTIAYAVQTGALTFPSTTLSSYSTPQFAIPVTGGTLNVVTAAGAGADTATISSVLTPLGTSNLTFTLTNINVPGDQAYFMSSTQQTALIQAVANGTVALNDGTDRVATVSDRIVTLTGNVRVTSGQTGIFYNVDLATPGTTLQGSITGGTISVPQSAVAVPVPPTLPTVPTVPVQPGTPSLPPAEGQVTPPPVQPAPPTVNDPGPRPTPPVGPDSDTISLSFAEGIVISDQSDDLLWQLTQSSQTQESEVDESPLAVSRIHGGLRAD